MEIKIIYEDDNVLVVDKPAGMVTIDLIDLLSGKYSNLKKVHRLDKDTSGVLLIAKNEKSLIFLQKQFSAAAKALADKKDKPLEKTLEKRYIALVVGKIKNDKGTIETLIGRNPKDGKKQKVYLPTEPDAKGEREAITGYKVMERFKDYTLLEVSPKTGRKHQIRCHFSYLGHPIAGDKIYGFKNQPCPENLNRQFLHSSYIKIKMPDGKIKAFKSELADDLKICLPTK